MKQGSGTISATECVKVAWLTLIPAIMLLAFAPLALAAPQGPWVQPAANLSLPGQTAQHSQITTAPDGTTTAIWRRSNGANDIIQAATRAPGGSFGNPVDLSATGQNADRPQISTAPDGTATAAWYRSDGSKNVIQTAIRQPGGTFGLPVDLSATGQDAFDPQISTAPDGTTTVVWYRSDGSKNIIQAATRPPAGPFGTPVDLSVTGQDANRPQISTAPDGTTTVVWRRYNGSNYIIQAAIRPSGGSFGAPVDLSATGYGASTPRITTSPDRSATVVWSRYNGSKFIIQATTRPSGGTFGIPVDLSATGQSAISPNIATAPDGTTTTIWARNNGSNDIIQAASRPPGGSFGSPADLSPTGQGAYDNQVAVTPDGTVTALWYRYDGSANVVQAATRPPGGPFGSPVNLSATGLPASAPQISTAPDGSATAIWSGSDGVNGIIQTISTARPSPSLSVSKAGSGSGAITSTPAGIDCGSDCAENFLSYTKVTLTATPVSGSTFEGWGDACLAAEGNTCDLSILDNQSVVASFGTTPPVGKAKLRIIKLKPKKPRAKRGKTVKIKVTGKNVGEKTTTSAKLCLKLTKSIKKKLKPTGRTCQKLGSLGPGKAGTRSFKLKATSKARQGKEYKVTFKLSASGTTAVTRTVKVKVK